MISQIELTKQEDIKTFQRMSSYYRRIYNIYYYYLIGKQIQHSVNKLLLRFSDIQDKRLYIGLVNHIQEEKGLINKTAHYFIFRMNNVCISKGSFWINGHQFDVPEIFDYYDNKSKTINANIKFNLYRNKLTATIDTDSLVNLKKDNNRYNDYIHDYIDPEAYITNKEMFIAFRGGLSNKYSINKGERQREYFKKYFNK